ncbi:MAG: hypothetical protein WB565_15260 [Acidimicrobiales bacterium]
MEVTNTMDALDWLRKHLEDADPDLLRSMVKAFADQLISAEASALCNAGYRLGRIGTKWSVEPCDRSPSHVLDHLALSISDGRSLNLPHRTSAPETWSECPLA